MIHVQNLSSIQVNLSLLLSNPQAVLNSKDRVLPILKQQFVLHTLLYDTGEIKYNFNRIFLPKMRRRGIILSPPDLRTGPVSLRRTVDQYGA
jgi:hypothetical protein